MPFGTLTSLFEKKKQQHPIIVNKPGVIFGIFSSPIKTHLRTKMALEALSLKELVYIILPYMDLLRME